MADTASDAIQSLRDLGYTVFEPGECIVEPRRPDEELAAACHQIQAVLRMASDMAANGAVYHIKRPPWLNPNADPKRLWAGGIMRMLDEILATAVVDNA
jgi:hypothetical protein